jgi:ubiquinol-cytochrome c reductase subunit 9
MPSFKASQTPLNALNKTIYSTFFKRNSFFLAGIFSAAFVFELAFDRTADNLWKKLNKGVSFN